MHDSAFPIISSPVLLALILSEYLVRTIPIIAETLQIAVVAIFFVFRIVLLSQIFFMTKISAFVNPINDKCSY